MSSHTEVINFENGLFFGPPCTSFTDSKCDTTGEHQMTTCGQLQCWWRPLHQPWLMSVLWVMHRTGCHGGTWQKWLC